MPTFQKWHEELTLCKDKIYAISWVPVPQTSSLRGEVDALTKTLQAKNVSKSHHLSCWAKTAVDDVHATLCLLKPSSYLLGAQSMECCTGQQANVHIIWQISRCSRKVGTNLANLFWDQQEAKLASITARADPFASMPSHVGNHLSPLWHHKALYIPCECLPGKPKCPMAWNQLHESITLRAFVQLWCVLFLYTPTSSNNSLWCVSWWMFVRQISSDVDSLAKNPRREHLQLTLSCWTSLVAAFVRTKKQHQTEVCKVLGFHL